MKIVVGANGRLGTAICTALGAGEVIAPARSIYVDWWQPGMDKEIGAYLDKLDVPIECIFIAAGIIDPEVPALIHEQVNFHLPRHILSAAEPRGIRVITFGTMMEVISEAKQVSAYIASKCALAQHVQDGSLNALHVRVNTLYGGGAPTPRMFTGQMVAALATRSPFRMSPGNQLREYHHVDDEAQAILALASSSHRGVLNLNHGAPITLADLAHRTFEAFGALNLLCLGALPAPKNERFDVEYNRDPTLREFSFRDALVAMPLYVRECLAASGSNP